MSAFSCRQIRINLIGRGKTRGPQDDATADGHRGLCIHSVSAVAAHVNCYFGHNWEPPASRLSTWACRPMRSAEWPNKKSNLRYVIMLYFYLAFNAMGFVQFDTAAPRCRLSSNDTFVMRRDTGCTVSQHWRSHTRDSGACFLVLDNAAILHYSFCHCDWWYVHEAHLARMPC